MQRLLFILQHKLIIFENVTERIVNLNVICVKNCKFFFHRQCFRRLFFVYIINATIILSQNQIMNLTKNKIENYIFIRFDKLTKWKRVILINDCVKQYISRIVIIALSVNENLYEKNSKNIFEFIKILQIFNALTQQNCIEILTTHA